MDEKTLFTNCKTCGAPVEKPLKGDGVPKYIDCSDSEWKQKYEIAINMGEHLTDQLRDLEKDMQDQDIQIKKLKSEVRRLKRKHGTD